MYIISTFDNIDALLQEQNRKQKELLDYLGLNKTTYTQWRSGKSVSYNKYLVQISEFFNVSVEKLLGAENKEPDEHRKAMLDYFHSLSTEDLEKAHAVAKLITDKKEAPPKKDDA